MLSYAAQEYVANMLEAYLENETTQFDIDDIGHSFPVWVELERAGIAKIDMDEGIVTLDPDAVLADAYPDDEY